MHDSESPQSRGVPPPHVPAVHVSPVVQYMPSSHDPVRGDHAVMLIAGLHSWQGFDGFVVPDATHIPLIVQPVDAP